MTARLVLASQSPRRAELLTTAGFEFEIDPADVDETVREGEAPETYAQRIARDKALTVAARHPSRIVLAADTIVVCDGAVFGKPVDRADARRMLRALSGRDHEVLTAVVVAGSGRLTEHLERTRVTMTAMTPADIDWYLDSGEAEGKAGAYAIQGRAARFIPGIEGSYSNVVGLPLAAVHRMLGEALTR